MPRPPQSERFVLAGPAGKLEAILESPADDTASAAAVVLHPHPQHGGTMHNKVAHTLARSFVKQGFVTLRFNFRGTEESDGQFDNGRGELDDALAAVEWLRQRQPDMPLWLGGFSFGAAIAVRAATTVVVDGLISIAPAVQRFASGLDGQPRCPWLIVQGDEDELVDIDATLNWISSLEPGPELIVMEGAEHFFHGRLRELRETIVNFIEMNMRMSTQNTPT